jgi:hypothetical protein
MQSVESVLKMEILNALRAVQSVETPDGARQVAETYWSAVQRARAFGYKISAISFGDSHEPVDVRFEHIPGRAACA